MRSLKRVYVIGGLTLALAVGASSLSFGQSTIQTVDGVFTKKGKATKKGAPGSLQVTTTTTQNAAGAFPHASKAEIDFDKGLKFNITGIPTCDKAAIEGTTTEIANAACGPASIGSGSAQADLGGNKINFVVTAYNGVPQGGNPVILLHTRATNPGSDLTLILDGVLSPAPDQSKYGKRLTVNVPETPAALTTFTTTVEKIVKKKKNGKKKIRSYVSGKCTEGTYDYQATLTFTDNPVEVATDAQPC